MPNHEKLSSANNKQNQPNGSQTNSQNRQQSPYLDVMTLQRTIGNQKVIKYLQGIQKKNQNTINSGTSNSGEIVQRDAGWIPKQDSPYFNIGTQGNVGPDEEFDHNQRQQILAANFKGFKNNPKLNGTFDIQKDDSDGTELFDPADLKPIKAEVDHIIPKTMGGINSEKNAQVLAGNTNASKGDTYPWGGYSGARVYDPAQNKVYNSYEAAQKGGADLTTLKNYVK